MTVHQLAQERCPPPLAYQPPASARHFDLNHLLQIAMPIGGIGSGNVCLNGSGGLQDFALRQKPATTALPDNHGTQDSAFALIHVKGQQPVTRLLEGPLPPEKLYDQALQGQGYRKGGHEGLPRFRNCSFNASYPFGTVSLSDPSVPLSIKITGWNPFLPGDDLSSSLPAAILEYAFENTSESPVEFEFSYHAGHLARGKSGWLGTRNVMLPKIGVSFINTDAPDDPTYGSAALAALCHTPKIKTHWPRGGWFDDISLLWREGSTGSFQENQETEDPEQPHRAGGSLLFPVTLAPGESVCIPIALAWHFPNTDLAVGNIQESCAEGCDCTADTSIRTWRPFYAGVWRDAVAVVDYLKSHYITLRNRTLAFNNALFSSTLPAAALDAIASNLAILKSPTVLRQENGNLWAWEGCFAESGCCPGSCTHVWNYAQSVPHLFPALERTLREQELLRSMDQSGHVQFRAALPDGAPAHDHHAAADGQLGGIMKAFRDWQISGDTEWLRQLYPALKRSLDYGIRTWDPDRKGGLFEPHHNTYDIEFWSPDGMCGSIYAGALSAMAEIAKVLGHSSDSAEYDVLAQRAALFLDEQLFNGEYYQQSVQWKGLRDKSFITQLPQLGQDSCTGAALHTSGPKYQYGSGCLSDGILGVWMTKMYGIPSLLNHEHVRSALRAIFDYNWKSDLFDHACTQRPGYANGHEPGLLLCTWPHGDKPSLPFVYSDEVWTGIEYQVAAHLISEGFVDEGLTIVEGTRSRYDGHVRNPFNEYECGSYYARAMASYALLGALSGFRYSAVEQTLWFGPQLDILPFQTFFSTATGWGTIRLEGDTLTIALTEGELALKQLVITRGGDTISLPWDTRIQPSEPREIALTG